MKKFIIILIVTALLAVIAYNVGQMMARKVFEGEITANSVAEESENEQTVQNVIEQGIAEDPAVE